MTVLSKEHIMSVIYNFAWGDYRNTNKISRRWPGGKGRSLETEMLTCFKAQVLDIMCILELGGNLIWLEWNMDIGGQYEMNM